MPRVVIVGAGFAGAYCARGLNRAARRGEIDVVLIDRNNYFVFHPLLVEAGTGSLQPRHVVVPLRPFAPDVDVCMGEVLDIDLERRRLTVELPETGELREETWDHLVLAPGSITRRPEIPGFSEHGLEVKGVADAIALRDRAVRLLEAADATRDPVARRRLLQFVVVGGSYTGVEVAGEFDVFLRHASRDYPSIAPGDARITLVELGDRILPALDEDLAAYALEKLRERGVEIVLGQTATSIAEDHVVLSGGRRIEARTVIWCAGIAPSPLLDGLDLPKRSGWLLCEPTLRVEGQRDLWGIGDCAINPDPHGTPYPPTAQHACRQGEHLARNLRAALAGGEVQPFVYRSQGSLAPLGCRTAVAKVFALKLSGFWAWFLWRTVYLLKMPGLSRKLRVAADWTLDLLFRREFAQLGVHQSAPLSSGHRPPGRG